MSPATLQRIWKKHKLRPHRIERFIRSSWPKSGPSSDFHEPSGSRHSVKCGEKSQSQDLDRTQPIPPLRPGLPERQAHDYKRHGTTTLFAALNVIDGSVIADCQPRHRHQELVRFLERIDRAVDPAVGVHLVLVNYGTHKHPVVKNWLATSKPLI